MQEWKHRHDSAGVENAGVEISSSSSSSSSSIRFSVHLQQMQDNRHNIVQQQLKNSANKNVFRSFLKCSCV